MSIIQEQLLLIQTQFHWLRPYWLLALLPAILLMILLWRQKRHAYQWQQLVAPELLPFLLDGKTIQTKKSLLWVLLLAWVASSVAMAGPSWIKRPTPVEKNQNALVILLDLSYSMISEDIKPSRIARARLKIADILRERQDGQTALVAYAGEAHTVTPLSDDTSTIVSLLSSMHPNIMPLQGSNTEAAVERGIQLLHDAGATQGDLLLVTDGVVPEAFGKIRSLLANKKIHLDILGVGTTQAAPIPNANGGFLQDNSGKIITTQLNSAELTQLAQSLNSRYHEIVNSNADIEYLKAREYKDSANKIQRDFDQWIDNGYWLVFFLLLVVLFCFRRGVLLSFLLIPLVGLSPSKSYAFGWNDVWLTKDQQAQRELKNGDAKKAAEQFESQEWKASAQYRAGDYAGAAKSFEKIDTAEGHYNRGNALAKSGKLEEAIKAYDEALKRDPDIQDAKKNRDLVDNLLKQQKQQQNKNNQDQNKKDQNQNDKQDKSAQDDKNQKNSDQGSKDNENKDKENKNKENSESEQNKDQSAQHSSNGSDTNNQSSAGTQDRQHEQQKSQAASSAQGGSSGQSSSASAQQSAAGRQASSESASSQAARATLNQNNLTDEQKQALEQWLRRVPDDPGGLLRNKFKYQYEQKLLRERNGESNSPDNNADQRL